ncbi:MAG: HemK/PrmC family methyltransferase [Minisyncoccia bacterium]
MNIKEIVRFAVNELNSANIPSAQLDAEVLLLKAITKKNADKSWLYINNGYHLTKNEEEMFFKLIKRRKKHEPVAYLINNKEFYGYDFYVDKNVLIPRPETEIIVQEALEIIRNSEENKTFDLLDIGTGSGCIIISILNELAKEKRTNKIKNAIADDISINAIKIAKINSKNFQLNNKIKFIISGLEEIFDYNSASFSKNLIITANLPYIDAEDYKALPANVKKYEPKIALHGGKNGITYIRRLIKIISIAQNNFAISISAVIEADPKHIEQINILIKQYLKNFEIVVMTDLSQKKRFLKITDLGR